MSVSQVQPDADLFRFTLKRDCEGMTIEVHARINALNATPIRKRAIDEIKDGAIWVTLDLKHCDAVDERELGKLYSIAKAAEKKGGMVTVLDANPQVFRAFHDWGVAAAFTFATSEARSSSPGLSPTETNR